MRKIIAALQTSVDGFIEGSNRELDWAMAEDEETWRDLFEFLEERRYLHSGARHHTRTTSSTGWRSGQPRRTAAARRCAATKNGRLRVVRRSDAARRRFQDPGPGRMEDDPDRSRSGRDPKDEAATGQVALVYSAGSDAQNRGWGAGMATFGGAPLHGAGSRPAVATGRREAMTDHKTGTREEWLAAARAARGREGADAAQRRASASGGGRCPGSASTECRFETDEGRRPSLISSEDARSSSSTTSCSARTTRPVPVLLGDRGRLQRLRRPPGQPLTSRSARCRAPRSGAAGVPATDGVEAPGRRRSGATSTTTSR